MHLSDLSIGESQGQSDWFHSQDANPCYVTQLDMVYVCLYHTTFLNGVLIEDILLSFLLCVMELKDIIALVL
jgi:hypothetical protein